jgi:hypothetical protein
VPSALTQKPLILPQSSIDGNRGVQFVVSGIMITAVLDILLGFLVVIALDSDQ